MNSIFAKNFEDLDYSDIKNLIINRVPESSVLDYKSQMIKSNKLGKLIAAFANGSGGYIVFGVSEEIKDGKKTGKPEDLIGIEKKDYTNLITSIAMGQTQPQVIPRIRDFTFPDKTEKVILIIKIKEYLNPVMWKNRWPIRINDQVVYADNSLMKKLFDKEGYTLKKKIQKIFNNINRNLQKISIDSDEIGHDYYKNYYFSLKKKLNHEETNRNRLVQFQKEFTNYIKSFKDDWKYFGILEIKNDISFCFGRYTFFNKLIRVPSTPNIPRIKLIDTILKDIKNICRNYYQINLD